MISFFCYVVNAYDDTLRVPGIACRGRFEQEAMAAGAMRILTSKENALINSSKLV